VIKIVKRRREEERLSMIKYFDLKSVEALKFNDRRDSIRMINREWRIDHQLIVKFKNMISRLDIRKIFSIYLKLKG